MLHPKAYEQILPKHVFSATTSQTLLLYPDLGQAEVLIEDFGEVLTVEYVPTVICS
jgi:hypothetical protein